VILIDHHPGTPLVAGRPIGAAWPVAGGEFDDDAWQRVRDGVAGALFFGYERTPVQDVALGLRQLTDVATKALSPGINDPTTAVHALGHSAALLCEIAACDLGPKLLCDRDPGTGQDGDKQPGDQQRGETHVRVVLNRPDMRDLLDLAVAQPRRYGAGEPAVLARLFALLREVAWEAGPRSRDAVAAELARLRATVASHPFDEAERAHFAEMAAEVDECLNGHWTLQRLSQRQPAPDRPAPDRRAPDRPAPNPRS
jgi:uncharacterized membrane protein